MSFPKPTSITAATCNRYATIWLRLMAQAQRRHPDVQGVAIVARTVDDLIESKPTISRSTFRQYKAASLHVLVSLTQQPHLVDRIPTAILSAIDRLAATSSEGCMRKSQRTSARKAKRLPSRDVEAIERNILERCHRSVLALPTLGVMTVLRLTGARPCELLNLTAQGPAPGILDVTIRNAKATNGRGLGEDRTIHLRGLSEAEVAIVRDWPKVMEALAASYAPEVVIAKIGKYFSRAARRALGRRSKYPSLYSFRHQLSSDAKAAGLPSEEIAALMGHASDVTAMRHYGRRISGQGGIKAHANPSSIGKVRRKAKPLQVRNFTEAPKDGFVGPVS